MKGLSSILGGRIAVAHASPQRAVVSPFAEERRHVEHARDVRRREFFAGRDCVRAAMAALGLPPIAIPVAMDRSPVWPSGLVGSISHCENLCIAAVARIADGYRAIGLDVEPAEALPEDILDTVCTPAERDWLERQPTPDRSLLARVIFSAKECAYKCQYPLTRRLIDFHTFEIEFGAGTFTATFTMPIGDFQSGESLPGRFLLSEDHIVCAMALEQDSGMSRRRHALEPSACA